MDITIHLSANVMYAILATIVTVTLIIAAYQAYTYRIELQEYEATP